MKEIKDNIGFGILLLIVFLQYIILHTIVKSQFWLIVIIGISIVLYFIFVASKIEKLLDKINFEKLFFKLFQEAVAIFALIGLIWFISFAANRTRYDIRLNAPDSENITLIVNKNWGLKTNTYNVNFDDYYWKYQDKSGDKPKWLTIPEKKGIFEDN